ncbi:hypothetical protein FS837_006365 [Tulasnella sp. UAMH 9824]|nr:hypothetical protein FS837_006365 [Tulasnella sp. UAMH 9824]
MKLSLFAPFVAIAAALAAPVPQSFSFPPPPVGSGAPSFGIPNILILSSIRNALALVLNSYGNAYVQLPNRNWNSSYPTYDNYSSDTVVSQHHDYESTYYKYQPPDPVPSPYGLD